MARGRAGSRGGGLTNRRQPKVERMAEHAYPPETKPLETRSFRQKLWLARAMIAAERLYPALFPALVILGGFLVITLFDLWRLMPAALHLLLLGAIIAGLAFVLHRARGTFAWPTRQAGLARLEGDSGAAHQPLRALEDRLPEDWRDPQAAALWRRHLERMRQTIANVRLTPRPSPMPALDPWAGRALVLLLLVVGLVDARGDIGNRLWRAVTPGTAGAAALPVDVTLWVVPPDYTGRPPLTIEQTRGRERLDVPAGSEAVLQLHNLPAAEQSRPQIRFDGEPLALGMLGGASGEARLRLERPGRLDVLPASSGQPLAAWQVTVLPDLPPSIDFAAPPAATHRQVLELAYQASDDYGIRRVALDIVLAERPEEAGTSVLAEPARLPPRITSTAYADLTAHPFAGLEVELRLVAVDGLEQEGHSETVRMVLPERRFEHPLARAVVNQRKLLVREPENRHGIVRQLDLLAETTLAEEAGTAIQLGLAMAASRLRYAEDAEARRSVVDLLWELALMIEEGTLSIAERSLREIQDELRRALEEGADDATLEALMDELREAMDRFLDELTRQAMEQMRNMPQNMPPNMLMQPIDPSRMVDRQQLQEMLDRAREMMQGGAREQAQALLEQLQQMLENLQAGVPQMQPSPGEEALSDLQRMIELQQNLLDRSFQMQQQGQEGGEPGQQGEGQQGEGQSGDTGQAAAEQEALRRALGELMRRMGEAGMEIPRALGQAEMQMRGARDALEGGEPGGAVPPQGEAIDLMQQAGQAMLDQMREQMANQPGGGEGFGPPVTGAQREGRDPLGRPTQNQGGWDSDGTEVPREHDLGRARDVLEELYRRSRDQGRPRQELDYIDRLLERF